MIVTGAQLVATARKDIDQSENPLGSNTGAFVIAAQHSTFLPGTRWPWCAAEVCYVCQRSGVPLSYPSAGAHDLANHYAPGGGFRIQDAKPGMIVDFNIGTGHTGIFVSVDLASGTLTTIDGNWGDKVALVTDHRISEIRRIWRVPGVSYATATPPTPPVAPKKLPPFVVATSASGHRKVVFTTSQKRNLVRWLTTHQLARLFPNGITISRGKAR